MARAGTPPAPSTAPFGGGGRSYSAYDVINVEQEAALEFQKAQAKWDAGKLSNDAYLAAYRHYLGQLDKETSTYVNAKQSYEQTVYVFKRDDIVDRIDNGDESAWRDLLAYDRAGLQGLNRNSTEYAERVARMRSTQNSIFQKEAEDKNKQYSNRLITLRQLRNWYTGQLNTDLTVGNPALRTSISTSVDDLNTRIQDEQRNKMLKKWRDGDITTTEFLVYAHQQVQQAPAGSPLESEWRGYIVDARTAQRQASLEYRWSLSSRYHDIQQQLKGPPPNAGQGTRVIFRDGKWVIVDNAESPTPEDVAAYQEWQKAQAALQQEADRIEARMAASGGDFVTPEQMQRFYLQQAAGMAKGSPEYLATMEQANRYEDIAYNWQIIDDPASGYRAIPVLPNIPTTQPTREGNNPLPGEQGITIDRFMRALAQQESGGNYRARNDTSGAYGKYQIMPSNWPAWAKKYLGNRNAPQTPRNQEIVAKGKLQDLHRWLGSWAMVAHWWLTGDDTRSVRLWSDSSTRYVNNVMGMAGAGSVPYTWNFRNRNPRSAAVSTYQQNYPGRQGWGGRTDVGGGANLTDISAGAKAYGVNIRDQNLDWNDFVRQLKHGKGGVLMGLMAAVQGTNLDRWDPEFAAKGEDSAHGVMVWGFRMKDGEAQALWMDPLATDGYKGEWVDLDTIKAYASAYTGTTGLIAAGMSNGSIGRPGGVVSEREFGPWTGCMWASAAMLVNAIRGRPVASMQEIRRFGESGQYSGTTFRPYRDRSHIPAASEPRGRANNDDRAPYGRGGGKPTVPGTQPGADQPGRQPWQWPKSKPEGEGTEMPRGSPVASLDGTASQEPVTSQVGQPAGNPPAEPATAPSQRAPDFFTAEVIKGRVEPNPGWFPAGMTPGDYDNFYGRARDAFTHGETTFVVTNPDGTTVNYYFPADPESRRTEMEHLDDLRINLRLQQWVRARQSGSEDEEANKRDSFDAATRDAAHNAYDMLFIDQPPGSTEVGPNANPGADIVRVSGQVNDAYTYHLEEAKRKLKGGDETGAMAEIQIANDLVDATQPTLDDLTKQLDRQIGQIEESGVAPTEEQRGQQTGARDWQNTSGLSDNIEAAATDVVTPISKFIMVDGKGNPVLDESGRIRLQQGVFRVLVPNDSATEDDTIDFKRPDPGGFEPNPTGGYKDKSTLKDYVPTSLYSVGRNLEVQVPYEVDQVGEVVTRDGQHYPILGKVVNATLDGRNWRSVEQPFAPGKWSTSAVVYRAPDSFRVEYDESGNPQYIWQEDDGRTIAVSWNEKGRTYDLYEGQPPGNALLGQNDQWVWKPLGNLAQNAGSAPDWMAAFQRDFTHIDNDVARVAADTVGATLGHSDAEIAEAFARDVITETRKAQATAKEVQAARAKEAITLARDFMSRFGRPPADTSGAPVTPMQPFGQGVPGIDPNVPGVPDAASPHGAAQGYVPSIIWSGYKPPPAPSAPTPQPSQPADLSMFPSAGGIGGPTTRRRRSTTTPRAPQEPRSRNPEVPARRRDAPPRPEPRPQEPPAPRAPRPPGPPPERERTPRSPGPY